MHVLHLTLLLTTVGSFTLVRDNGENEIAELARETYEEFCKDCSATLVVRFGEEDASCTFLKSIKKHIMPYLVVNLEGPSFLEYGYDRADLTIIFLGNRFLWRVQEALKPHETRCWRRNGKFLVVSSEELSVIDIEKAFRMLWDKKMLRVFLAFWSKVDQTLKLYTYNPFTGEFCKDVTNTNSSQRMFLLEFELFDLNGHVMKTFLWDSVAYSRRCIQLPGTNEFIGLDGKFLNQVRSVLNVTVDIRRNSEGSLFKPNFQPNQTTLAKAPQILFENFDFDIWFTAIRSRPYNLVDAIYLHERDDLCVVVPRGRAKPQYLYIFDIIPPEWWPATIISAVLVALTLRLIRRVTGHGTAEASLDLYRIILNVPINLLGKNQQEQMLLSSWIWFSLIFSVVFQCTLMSTLVVPKFYKNLKTIKQLIASKLPLYATKYDMMLLSQSLSGSDSVLMNQIIEVDNKKVNGSWGNYLTNSSGLLLSYERARGLLKELKNQGIYNFKIMKEHPLPNAQSYNMPKEHPYSEEIQWIVHKVHESGLYWYWRKTDFGYENLTDKIDRKSASTTNDVVVLKLMHLQSAFYLLFLGLVLSAVVLFIELWYYHKKNK